MLIRAETEKNYQKALSILPGGVSSPVRALKEMGVMPLIAEKGEGSYLFDVDGNRYIDYCMNFGASILGHAPPLIVRALQEQLEKGVSFGVTTPLEEQLGSKIASALSSIEKIRFVSSGTEATMTAIRLARGFTGRTKIIKFSGHYHGHLDSLLVQAGSGALHMNRTATSKGISPALVKETLVFPFNDFAVLESFFSESSRERDDLAAVIVEPIAANQGVILPEPHFLEFLEQKCRQIGALLIFDEVITGFRVGWKGAQGLYNIRPDLTCLGKVISGALPAAAVGGRKEVLDQLAPLGEVYQAGTLAGNPLAMRAGLETLSALEQEGFYEMLDRKAEKFQQSVLKILQRRGKGAFLSAKGSMFSLFFDRKASRHKEIFFSFFRYLLERGIYAPPGPFEAWFISSAHSEEDLMATLDCMEAFFETL